MKHRSTVLLCSLTALSSCTPYSPSTQWQSKVIKATDQSFKKYTNTSPSLPEPLSDGKIPTLNQTGFMTPDRDTLSDDFIRYAAELGSQGVPVVDIGSAYGVIALPALEQGAVVIANDLDERHLLILRERVPKKYWDHLYLNSGALQTLDFPEQSIGAVLLRRVVHFFTPEELETSIDKIYTWLKPGGRVFIITMSPFHYSLKNFAPLYEKRWAEGSAWPGEIFDMKSYVPNLAKDIPDYLHVMDERPFKKALEKRGFIIEKAYLYGYSRPNRKADDTNGYCAIQAMKPY
ncbi:MAG: class I SAM-dependent methyltransferase [Alphaproteobacteria bacterium]|nr:class I SAM-dependent methyltransferase [Alphaproteobacteria bacterium]